MKFAADIPESLDGLRAAITAACRRDEASCVAALAAELEQRRVALQLDPAAVDARARALVADVRRRRHGASGVDQLMHEFSLSSQEGVALMCLAEALLRIPDRATADRLIRDKIGKGDWRPHLGHSGSLFVNAATWGLLITGRLVATRSERALGGALSRLLARGGEPVVRRGVDFAMRLLGQQFVMGETIDAALRRSRDNELRGYAHSFDMLGEAALTASDAERYTRAYEDAIHAIGAASAGRGPYAGPGISIKLSALHPRYCRAQRRRVLAELLPQLTALMGLARGYDIGVNIDAEESDRLELSLELFERLVADPALAGWNGLGFVVQAYQKRAPGVIDYLVDLARRSDRRLMIRLVKGAYWDSEIKRAQIDGLAGYPVYTRKPHTDLAYLVCACRLLAATEAVYPQFATHNAHTLAAVYEMALAAGAGGLGREYEFQCLHGMGESLYDSVVGPAQLGRLCRIYAPVGSHQTLLPYLVRRLLENGANTSFVNRIVDERVPVDALVADPLAVVAAEGGGPHPAIPLPAALYGAARINSAGLDLASDAVLATLETGLGALAERHWWASPLLAAAGPDEAACRQRARPVTNPADSTEVVGSVVEAGAEEVAGAIAAAVEYAPAWSAAPAVLRATCLERAAELFEAHRIDFVSLCVREAGKTWGNAVAELREAVDFCRYYAAQSRSLTPPAGAAPGPLACISPWNFPLAIFVGQVAAALAAGRPVLAKPAMQTPLTAALAVRLLHEAGVPRAALQLLPGRGASVGAALVADERVGGVLFTGSTEVARQLNRSLARRPATAPEPCLIAETGGQNAMIVDSSALPEQVVQDVLVSAFDSAGQRCSALRVLCLQREVADRLQAMLVEAMQELRIGDPARLDTDVGPVIDAAAAAELEAHVARMQAAGRHVFRLPLPAACAGGSYVAPTLIEIDALTDVPREVFGPVLHVLRFEAVELEGLIAAINATGYGLTGGLHGRIDETVDRVVAGLHVGNLYVNRNMIGAVVGVQPFGGEGLSGTGPKAGGPLYLHRLLGSGTLSPVALGATPPEPAADGGALGVLARWAQAEGEHALVRACAYYGANSLNGSLLTLPGPTGERNTLRFVPRGAVLCVASSAAALLEQLAAVLATGNAALFEAGAPAYQVAACLPAFLPGWLGVRGHAAEPALAAALYEGTPDGVQRLRTQLAERPGALLPVILPGADGRYPLHRLVTERVVSINTAAAGGNATLMTLG
ncbi:trifunctional transcriptional regulator/proline dehydrogenase/L-glutamate gamma-semialdehyde dehydrogenase [Azoarcus sp. DD4]|uniref:bifunctional proline dehydrogenase/L-glutamate gamma-semialdehyde dehydrogenase PutA n=1 Tax=Azoarcus sp. DD4 TaxID=2027405 RepID=UPI00112E5301|nr:bifunctional proline dehydrogenase/L-glutamate gamma-semialdehyde dehydrogenase PutA [Azoarcus sp. DD4]QDF99174.1 trifunctional transcriptional regulator/proline dehydrogenase/L-glutamate gamma-semialdehyde dehydrogenase [Azoarcus sp. DD4]